jgi:hypothetical protein
VSTDQIAIVIVTGRLSGLTSKALGRETVIKAKVSLIGLVAVLSVALTGCAGGGNQDVAPTQNPTATPTPTPTVTVPPVSPEEVWDSFNQISNASCKASSGGIVEEGISGPDLGARAIRYSEGRERTVLYLPHGEVLQHYWGQLLACEVADFIQRNRTEAGFFWEGVPSYSEQASPYITFDPLTSKFTAEYDYPERTLVFEVLDGKFSIVEEVEEGSKTKLTYGPLGTADSQIVKGFFNSMYGTDMYGQ